MKKLFLLLSIFVSLVSVSQDLHTPAEMLQIMEKSDLMYEMNFLANPINCVDRSENLVSHDFYRIKTDSSITSYQYKIKSEAVPYLEKAENHFSNKNIDSARIYYEKVFELDPQYYKVMTYIGQMYGSMGDLEKSLQWYKKTIEDNYIDYLAHWLIADIYRMQNDIDKAVNEITIASILNRNNPRLKSLQTEIYKLAKLKTDDWCFNPQIEISSEGKTVKVSFDEVWLGYAMPKAIWSYEPGYKQSMGVKENQFSTIEYKECLLNFIIALKNSKTNTKRYPDITTLKRAVDKGFITEYILYEILLPEHPFAASQFSEDTINKIKEYILTIRHSK